MPPSATHRRVLPMTVAELERACDQREELREELDFSRHALEAPELTLRENFHPFGFPIELRTNATEILRFARELWSIFPARFATPPMRVDVHVLEEELEARDCPPSPTFRMILPLLLNMSDTDNLSIADLDQSRTQVTLARSTLRHASFVKYFFLGSAPLCHIATRFAVPVHAACVSFGGRGILLCGDSGAGKSTLSYACARAGWTYTSDDACYLLHEGTDRTVTANCHQVRFRPTAATLFPEIEGREITPRAAGKPSIELPTSELPGIRSAPTAHVDFLVFLNRQSGQAPQLRPYRRDVARQFLRQVLFGSPESLAVQYHAAERLLTAEIFELHYGDLDWAIDRLQTLVREGR